MAPSPQLLALQYGLRLDASPEFIRGYVDGMRLDQRGQGVACGKGWIPRSKKCSRDKASQTSKEAKAKTVEKAKARGKLKGEVKAAKGQKPRMKEKTKTDPQVISETKIQRPKETGSDKQMTKAQLVEKMEEMGGRRWQKNGQDRMYFDGAIVAKLLKLSNSKSRQINAAKFYYDLNESTFVQGCNTKCGNVTDRGISGIGRPQRKPYWVEAISAAVGMK